MIVIPILTLIVISIGLFIMAESLNTIIKSQLNKSLKNNGYSSFLLGFMIAIAPLANDQTPGISVIELIFLLSIAGVSFWNIKSRKRIEDERQ